jgi:hypothetical protein
MASQKPPQSNSDDETTQARQDVPEATTASHAQNNIDGAQKLKIATATTREVCTVPARRARAGLLTESRYLLAVGMAEDHGQGYKSRIHLYRW